MQQPHLEIDLITLFPEMVQGFLVESIVGRAVTKGLVRCEVHNLRNWTHDRHKTTDERPFGGGAGMVLKPEPIFEAFDALRRKDTHAIYMSPDGPVLDMPRVKALASEKRHLIILSGHYEGIDQRVRDALIDEEISIGDYILTNGTLPAAVLIDAVTRYIPGVLGEENSLTQDAFNGNFLSFPQFTRPASFRGMTVPEVLLSGNHAVIAEWRQQQRESKTRKLRPDLSNEQNLP